MQPIHCPGKDAVDWSATAAACLASLERWPWSAREWREANAGLLQRMGVANPSQRDRVMMALGERAG